MNTQFQYIDVGVNIEITPRVHPDGDISLKGTVDVSQITGTSNIGGINQPVIGQKKTEIDVRLKEGEQNILAGLIERTDTKNVNGIPGLGEVPLMRYLFSDNSHEIEEDETLIVMTPHILRLPSFTAQICNPWRRAPIRTCAFIEEKRRQRPRYLRQRQSLLLCDRILAMLRPRRA